MAKLQSLQDLTRVREASRRGLKVRLDTGTVIRIGMGTCGIAAGARETMQAVEQELRKRNIQAFISSVGCIGMCAKEPLLDIQQGGKSRILYGNVQPEMVPRLIDEHLGKGQPVKEWVICRMPKE